MAEAAVEVASMEAEAVGFMVEAQAGAGSTEVEWEAASEEGLPRHGPLVPELQASQLHARWRLLPCAQAVGLFPGRATIIPRQGVTSRAEISEWGMPALLLLP